MATVEEIARVLAEHHAWSDDGGAFDGCSCGKFEPFNVPIRVDGYDAHARHQAEMLANLCPDDSDIGTPSRAQAEALCRLLVDSGDMTPLPTRQVLRLWDEQRVTVATERWIKDGRWFEVEVDEAGFVYVSIDLFHTILAKLGFSRMDES